MKIGITGGTGFIGWHLRCFLHTLGTVTETRIADRHTFSEQSELDAFVAGLDAIFHLAGVNRADDDQLISGNVEPAEQLVQALERFGNTPHVVYSSSTYTNDTDTPYGAGKSAASDVLFSWSKRSGAVFTNLIIPHVFGEYGRPHYNSGVATFCHQIVRGEEMSVNRGGQLELIHVQDLVEEFLTTLSTDQSSTIRIHGKKISVGDVVDLLIALKEEYIEQNRLPDLSDNFVRSMFNCLRGAIPYDQRKVTPEQHVDDRGWLIETVKAGSTGQCFVSTTKPGITRGNHYHRRKVERFFVLQGTAKISLRKLFTDDVVSYELSGKAPSYVDMPTLHTHKITNVGDDELITLFWADEFFDPENPDTYPENVEPEH